LFQCRANGTDSAIHHVRRSNDIGTGVGMRQCLFDQYLNRCVVEHITAVIDQAVLAMTGERIQGYIGDYAQLRAGLFEGAYCALGKSVRVEGFPRIVTFLFHGRNRKQCDGGNTQLHQYFRFPDKEIDTEAFNAGHGGDSLAAIVAVQDKYRVDKIIRAQPGFAHQAAGKIVSAHAPHAHLWILAAAGFESGQGRTPVAVGNPERTVYIESWLAHRKDTNEQG
jgi:hypothetical protein